MKITNKYIKDRVEALKAEGVPINVEFEGQPSRVTITDDRGNRKSPRLSATEADLWLSAYCIGRASVPGVHVGDEDTGHHVE